MKNQNVFKLTLSAVFLAMIVVCLFISSFIPGIDLTVELLTSFILTILIAEVGVRYGIATYAAACLLSFAILPNKLIFIPYAMYFGIYPIIKFFAEKPKKPSIQLIIKIVYFVILIVLAYFFMFDIFFGGLDAYSWLPTMIIMPIAFIVLLMVDYILSVLANIYFAKIKPKINRR